MDLGRLESLLPETRTGHEPAWAGAAALAGEPPPQPSLQAQPPPPQPHLLLFVGEAVRPEPALAAWLAREGLRCLNLPGPEPALRAASLAHFDTVLLEARCLRGRGGARALEALAVAHRCPMVVLADSPDEIDEILALETGADAYLPWPMAPRRLLAHLNAVLRRSAAVPVAGDHAEGATAAAAAPRGAMGAGEHGVHGEHGSAVPTPAAPLRFGGWTLELSQRRLVPVPAPVAAPGAPAARAVRLTFTHAALLQQLMAAGGRIVPSEALMKALPQHGHMPPRGLRLHMHRLRQRLRNEGVRGLQLEAVRGSGYVLVAG